MGGHIMHGGQYERVTILTRALHKHQPRAAMASSWQSWADATRVFWVVKRSSLSALPGLPRLQRGGRELMRNPDDVQRLLRCVLEVRRDIHREAVGLFVFKFRAVRTSTKFELVQRTGRTTVGARQV